VTKIVYSGLYLDKRN